MPIRVTNPTRCSAPPPGRSTVVAVACWMVGGLAPCLSTCDQMCVHRSSVASRSISSPVSGSVHAVAGSVSAPKNRNPCRWSMSTSQPAFRAISAASGRIDSRLGPSGAAQVDRHAAGDRCGLRPGRSPAVVSAPRRAPTGECASPGRAGSRRRRRWSNTASTTSADSVPGVERPGGRRRDPLRRSAASVVDARPGAAVMPLEGLEHRLAVPVGRHGPEHRRPDQQGGDRGIGGRVGRVGQVGGRPGDHLEQQRVPGPRPGGAGRVGVRAPRGPRP